MDAVASKHPVTSKHVAAALALLAGACSVAFLAMLPPGCGFSGENGFAGVLLLAAGGFLAAGPILVGNRRSVWLWLGAINGGAALSVVLLAVSLGSWAETCAR
jgi:hypothetical protein